jgi:hypothetical protein
MRFSIYGDSRRSDCTLYLETCWVTGDVVRRKGESASVCFAVGRHDVRLVQSEGAAGGRRITARSEEPSDVMQTHRSCRDFLPDAEADIARIRWQPRIFKLGSIAVPLIERLVECTAVCGLNDVPQTHDGAEIAGEVLLLIVSCLRQHREPNRTLRPRARQSTGSISGGRTEQECRNREQRQSAA